MPIISFTCTAVLPLVAMPRMPVQVHAPRSLATGAGAAITASIAHRQMWLLLATAEAVAYKPALAAASVHPTVQDAAVGHTHAVHGVACVQANGARVVARAVVHFFPSCCHQRLRVRVRPCDFPRRAVGRQRTGSLAAGGGGSSGRQHRRSLIAGEAEE